MQLYKSKKSSSTILNLDIFELLGLPDLDQAQKDKLLDDFQKLIIDYFLQEKLGDHLTREQMTELVEKFPPTDEKNMAGFLERAGEMLPNMDEHFANAITEVKARLVRDHYDTRKKGFEQLLKETQDEQERKIIEREIKECDLKLKLIDDDLWEMVAATAPRSQSSGQIPNSDNLSK